MSSDLIKYKIGDIIIPTNDRYIPKRYTIIGFYNIFTGEVVEKNEIIINPKKVIHFELIVNEIVDVFLSENEFEVCDNLINPCYVKVDTIYMRKKKIECLKKVMK